MDYDAMRSLDTRDGVAGKVCSRCGQWKALQSFSRKLRFFHSACKQCLQEAQAQAPKKDKRAYYKRYREANAEKIAAYRKANKWRFAAYTKKYLAAHPEKRRAARRKWENKHPERKREAFKRWRANNPDKAFLNIHRRRLRERLAPGKLELAEWQALKAAYEQKCLACGRCEPEIKLVPDHVVPLISGGSNYVENIQPLCEICNKRKNARTIDYRDGRDWRAYLTKKQK
jgi:5-methylcytosine-specific restriction endonuclease McrA